jgi:hypothetical protein
MSLTTFGGRRSGSPAGGIWAGRVTRATEFGLFVELPRLNPDVEFGPCSAVGGLPGPYEVGSLVAVGLREGRPDDLVVLGPLDAPFGAGGGGDGAPGADGVDGASAYELAVQGGFVGTLTQWLASLKGAKGDTGNAGAPGSPGAAGSAGAAGLSAYQVAVANGYPGTQAQWLASLVGPAGANGTNGSNGAPGVGVPTGGAVGQSLLKTGAGDYATGWGSPAAPANMATTDTTQTITGDKTHSGALKAVKKMQSGARACASSAANVLTLHAVTYPGGAFAAVPAVVATANSGADGAVTQCTVANVTATGFDIAFKRINTSSTTVYWVAMLQD